MSREEVSKSVDRKIFRRTAVKSKAVNLGNIGYRGGIRF